MLRMRSRATMTRRPKPRRGRRDFSLDELLTEVEPGPTDVRPVADPSEAPVRRPDETRDDQRNGGSQQSQGHPGRAAARHVSYGGRSDGSSTVPDVQDGTVPGTFGNAAAPAPGATAGVATGAGGGAG